MLEYAGVLALVAVIVGAVLVAGIPQRTSAGALRALCVIFRQDCPPDVVATVPPPPASGQGQWQGPPQQQRPTTFDGEPESDRWRNCPDQAICLYSEDNYRHPLLVIPLDSYDPRSGDSIDLRQIARSHIGSWVNNTDWDFCGSDDDHPEKVELRGSYHRGRNRDLDAHWRVVLGDDNSIDRIEPCKRRRIYPPPLIPVEEGGPDCPRGYVCLYDDLNFQNEIYRYNGGRGPDDNPGQSAEDYEIDLPEGVADRTSSWANNTDHFLCGYNHRSFRKDDEILLGSGFIYRPESGWQSNWVGLAADNTIDHIDPCDNERFEIPQRRGG